VSQESHHQTSAVPNPTHTDVVLLDGRHVAGVATPGQDAAVNGRVQRLDAAVQHLRE
jgi:hypothetical protein